jgi:hypothetical protein
MTKVVFIFPLMGLCLVLALLGDRASCSTKGDAVNRLQVERNDRLATGVWGGEHIRAEVSNSGAEIEFDCAHGSIEEPIAISSGRKFDVRGKYIPQHAGPIRRDEENTGTLVRYAGQVTDKEMTLIISDANTKETIATFTLTHGSDGRVMKCR